jgi:dTDP-4-dehydrorhamnose 3,5-epimerase
VNAGNFSVEEVLLGAAVVLRTRVHSDDRGSFHEAWREDAFRALGIEAAFVQDNHSRSRRGVIRGLHWQGPPSPQGKLVRCTSGRIWDVIVDLRGGSPDFGKWRPVELEAVARGPAEQRMLWVPPGFAHGFLALTDDAEVQYKVTAPWDRAAEGTLAFDDPELAIPWPRAGEPIVSAKDRAGLSFAAIRKSPPFAYGGPR